jgi:ascorbate PTS system EIIC component
MSTLSTVATWIASNIFGQPAILVGIIALIGLLVQRKSTSQVVSGTLKTIIGFLLILAGAQIITQALALFQPLWGEVFGFQQQDLGQFMGFNAFNSEFGSAIALSMAFGFLLNVVFARITPFKYIYLTGHMMFWATAIFAGIVVSVLGPENVSMWGLVLFLSVFMGLYWTLQPAIVQPFMRRVTGNDEIALGHTSASVAILSALTGRVLGKQEQESEEEETERPKSGGFFRQDTEGIELPKSVEFLRDTYVIIALVMGTLYIVGALIVSTHETQSAQDLIAQAQSPFTAAGQNSFIVFALIQGLTFAAGIAVVLYGVRMFIGEIVPAFRGFATKIVPEAKPALDCPVTYNYAPNATIIGFLGAFVAAMLWLVVLGSAIGYIFVPTMIVLFFHSATAGVFGNSTGGILGAFLGGIITATLVAWGQYLTVDFLISGTIPDTALWAGDSDMFILGPLVAALAKLFSFLI